MKQERSYEKDNSKNNSNCLAVFFGIIHFDDMLNSPGIRTSKKEGWFVGVSPYFLGAEIKTTTEHTTLTERYTKSPELWMLQTFTASTTDQAEGANITVVCLFIVVITVTEQ